MELKPIHESAIGLDVHQKHVTACLIAEQAPTNEEMKDLTFLLNTDFRTMIKRHLNITFRNPVTESAR